MYLLKVVLFQLPLVVITLFGIWLFSLLMIIAACLKIKLCL